MVSQINLNKSIEDLEIDVKRINDELSMLENAAKNTIEDLSDAWQYKNTLNKTQQRIDILREKKRNYY